MTGDDHPTQELDDETLLDLAQRMLYEQRHEDAARLYAQLATRRRDRADYCARAHYARGLYLLGENARAEARLELRHALALDPTLDCARAAIESIATTNLRKIELK